MNKPHRTDLAQDGLTVPLPDSVSTTLRRQTHAAHGRINHHPLLSGLTKPGYPLGRYKALLATYFHMYAAIEFKIDAFLALSKTPFDYEERRKLS